MEINKSEFVKSAVVEKDYPEFNNTVEFSFIGRSNVGKSSLINSLTKRKNLARTSKTPGRTQLINYFLINSKIHFVDLPGYGYAQVSKSEKEKWGVIIETYLSNRENLCEVILIVDIRHAPSKEDVMMYHWLLEYGFSGYVIATKADKISKGQWNKHLKVVRETLGIKDMNLVIPFSSDSKANLEAVHNKIEEILSCE